MPGKKAFGPIHLHLQTSLRERKEFTLCHKELLYPCQVQVSLLAMAPKGYRRSGVQSGHWFPMHKELYKDAQDNHTIHQPQDQSRHHPAEPAP